MSRTKWNYDWHPVRVKYSVGVDSNCGRIFVEADGFVVLTMSDKESLALAKKVLAANSGEVKS